MSKDFPQVLLKKGVKLDWLTPKWVYDRLDSIYHFKLDAATCVHNPMHTEGFFWSPEWDGLMHDWIDPTYVNPPYGRDSITRWLEKAEIEQAKGVTSIFLLPSRTGTKWFHRYIYGRANVEITFLPGRLTFDYCKLCYPDIDPRAGSNTAPFDSMIVVFYKRKPLIPTW